ncbi:hypothetical protein C5167_047134 [Papaver somniferum]|uniref:MADS-box domain-containing protein n=1 Tax=Papaver somniferum TaxID=3469 RepID=A0A4Y7LIN1_PAPSO|nr:hypothetical protein C5167_047134 [Papaver somniferum]
MGKRRIEMKKIEDRQKRNVCFTKRRHSLFNKAADLCRLTGADISLLVISPGEKVAQRKQELLAAAEPIATSTTTSTCTVGEMEEDSFLLEDDLEKLLSDAYDDAPNWLPSIDDSGMLFEGLDYDESWLPLGIDTVLVLVGPAILLLLKPAKDAEKSFSCLSLLGSILPYKASFISILPCASYDSYLIGYVNCESKREVIAELKAAGASWIQFDEPKLVMHLDSGELNAFTDAYSQLKSTLSGLNCSDLCTTLQELYPIPPPDRTQEDIPLLQTVRSAKRTTGTAVYVGTRFVKGSGKPMKFLESLMRWLDSLQMKRFNFLSAFFVYIFQLDDGDIICFQKPLPADTMTRCRYPDVHSFLDYVLNRWVVCLNYLEKLKEDDFSLELVARHLGLDDPTKIKLTPHHCCSQQPIAPAIKYHGFDHLSEMLIHHNQKSDILYFEVLDIPPPLLEGLKTLNVSFHHAKKDTVIHRISLPSKSTILEEEKNLGTRDCLVYVYHFTEDASETQKCSVVKTLVCH